MAPSGEEEGRPVTPSPLNTTFTREAVKEAYDRIKRALHETPIFTSTTINSLAHAPLTIFFKAETFQKTGAFKFRGASHAIARLPPSALKNGVVTHSSGNHSAALACAARERGVKCYVPANASRLKIAATENYGADITFVENPADREKVCNQVAERTGATIVPPFEHENIILGQGTAMLEFQEQMEEKGVELEAVVIPVGGGGLLAGCAVSCQGTGIRVFGAEPLLADDCARGIQQGVRARLESTPTTIADGLRTEVGGLNFALIQEHVERIFTVTEEQIAMAMRTVIEMLKLVIEPSAAVPVAVALFNTEFQKVVERDGIKALGIILEGGNIDTGSYEKMMPWIQLDPKI